MFVCPLCLQAIFPDETMAFVWLGKYWVNSPTPQMYGREILERYHQRCWTGPPEEIDHISICFKCGEEFEQNETIIQVVIGDEPSLDYKTPERRKVLASAHEYCWMDNA